MKSMSRSPLIRLEKDTDAGLNQLMLGVTWPAGALPVSTRISATRPNESMASTDSPNSFHSGWSGRSVATS